ncbi:RNA-binding protein 48-like isoform X3 [Carassius carassius]|uniref:RNA-binding protein 48-like isoform X3 n=1 Tax=Carassius carassius TaxID=217509 RepID=UPI002868FE54|nr:RNA-binding protein 48-like isoform X3 [Carassius carassius]
MDLSVFNPSVWDTQKVYKHHEQQNVAETRPKYREGRRLKAVKVYTINLESRFLIVQGVSAIGVMAELVQLFALYGVIEEYRALDEYPAEQFTEVYLFQFQKLTSASYMSAMPQSMKLWKRQGKSYRTGEDMLTEQVKIQKLEESRESSSSDTRAAAEPEIQKDSEKARMEIVNHDDMGFPVFPSLPVEDVSYRIHGFAQPLQLQWTTNTTLPTEDKMGSLHNSIPPVPETSKQSASSSSSCVKERDLSHVQKNLSPSVRFMPRTTHLESRKRKVEGQALFLNEASETETLIGPKLPELPKVDMEDQSLNVTASLIRQTMSKVASVPEVKPVQVKTLTKKPRRRI